LGDSFWGSGKATTVASSTTRTGLNCCWIFSFISHKEIRFLLPIVPYMCAVSGNVLAKIEEAAENRTHELCRVVDARRYEPNSNCLFHLMT
jgi:hypothetical protein